LKTGLYFGSFNPIHIGHLAIANYMTEYTDLDEIWFIVSPRNPFKDPQDLIPAPTRYSLVKKSIQAYPKIKVSDIELSLSGPSYTINTLNTLCNLFPDHQFIIVLGSDGISSFAEWKDADVIIENFERYIYLRPNYEINEPALRNCRIIKAPQIEISSSFIREAIREGKHIPSYLPPGIWDEVRTIYKAS
jgi:nicotinate-nucleotide adenylyltransferase